MNMNILTSIEVAQAAGVTQSRVVQLVKAGVIEGRQAGGVWLFPKSVIREIKARPEKRGRPKKVVAEAVNG